METINKLTVSRLVFLFAATAIVTGCGGGASGDTPAGGTPAPTVTFSANPSTVSSGGATTLNWSSTDATACSASSGWSGSKQTNNSETIDNILVTTDYTITCTGAGGFDSKTVTVTVSGASDTVSGSVDSSFINHEGLNRIYVYSGTVTPDDYDGDAGDPILSVPVTQITNSCAWGYSVSSLPAGNYTFALTNEAGNDDPTTDDIIVFSSVKTISKGSTALVQNMNAASILHVGSTRTYKTPSQANAVANDGDVIEIDAGTYKDDVVVWRKNNLTLRGVGGRPHIQSTKTIPYTPGNDSENGKGLWVAYGKNLKIENIELSGAKVPDLNGAGIRGDGNGLYVCNAYLHDNENGILGGIGNVLVEYTEFNNNGNCVNTSGCAHNMYISEATTKFTLKHSYSHHANQGHNVKSRAQQNYLLYNRIMDEGTGNSSYAIDISNGGLTYLIGNLIQQGPNTENSIMVNYGAEGLRAGRTHNFYMINNTLVNDRSSGTFVSVRTGTALARLINNLFAGNGTMVSGVADTVTNLATNNPGLEDISNYNYHLTAGSTNAINAGTAPGIGDGFDLSPKHEYLHNSQREQRADDGNIDIGAYEY